QRFLKQAERGDERQELLRCRLARHRPKPRPGAAGQDHCNQLSAALRVHARIPAEFRASLTSVSRSPDERRTETPYATKPAGLTVLCAAAICPLTREA